MRLFASFVTFALVIAVAQTTAAKKNSEISLKPCVKDHGVSLVNVLEWAFEVPDYLIDGPSWMWSECVDYTTTLGKQYPPGVLGRALVGELSAKLHLSAHKQSRVLDVFLLKQAIDGRTIKIPRAECVNGNSAPYVRSVKGVAVPLSVLAKSLSTAVRHPVLDETAIAGCFTFDLTWRVDSELPRAIHDQLGLELESAKRPIEMLIIDHIERWPVK